MLKPVQKPIKFIKNLLTKGKSYPITHTEAVIDSNGKTLPDLLELMLSTIPSTSGDIMSYTNSEGNTRYIATSDNPSGINSSMTEVTWLELKNLRDNSLLIAGNLYRITDYQCTTTQENTRSAGHQFDIVLLALSENKLAEEGWAMMHDNIYDVTFADGVVKKCWVYKNTNQYNLVDITSLLGCGLSFDSLEVDEMSKVAICDTYESEELLFDIPDLTYNYFQNSNLSAWKVWYCLDNDKSRFAWADDSVDEDIPESIITSDNDFSFYRDASQDIGDLYAWASEYTGTHYTENEIPSIGDPVFDSDGEPYKNGEVTLYTPAHEGTGEANGRGVIYRLIDEWNNDVGYDFKNIQFVRPMTDGNYDPDNGEDTWVYTFNGWDGDNSACVDATTDITLGFKDTDNNIHFIKSLGDNVFLEECCDIKIMDTESGLITLSSCLSTTLIATYIFELAGENGAIYIGNKKVLTEE